MARDQPAGRSPAGVLRNFRRAWTLPQHIRVVQTPGMMVLLHEFNGAYREVYLDGRPLPVTPNPTWNGYSTGHWEDDTLVIETNGIRDDMWLDIQGSPIIARSITDGRGKAFFTGTTPVYEPEAVSTGPGK